MTLSATWTITKPLHHAPKYFIFVLISILFPVTKILSPHVSLDAKPGHPADDADRDGQSRPGRGRQEDQPYRQLSPTNNDSGTFRTFGYNPSDFFKKFGLRLNVQPVWKLI